MAASASLNGSTLTGGLITGGYSCLMTTTGTTGTIITTTRTGERIGKG